MNYLKVFAFAIGLMFNASWIQATELSFQTVNLPKVQAELVQAKKPLVIYVAHTTCPYCKQLEKEIMPAVVNTDDYKQKIVLQKLIWNSELPVVWLDGKAVMPDDLVNHYKVRATPTLLFLDAQGNEVGKRIEGYRGADFYWVYLDRSIEEARTALANGS